MIKGSTMRGLPSKSGRGHARQQRLHVAREVPLTGLGEKFEEDLLRDVFCQPRRGREPQRQQLIFLRMNLKNAIETTDEHRWTHAFPNGNQPRAIMLKLAISHISLENARVNLETEAGAKDFEEIRFQDPRICVVRPCDFTPRGSARA
jgi:hypothetical protein